MLVMNHIKNYNTVFSLAALPSSRKDLLADEKGPCKREADSYLYIHCNPNNPLLHVPTCIPILPNYFLYCPNNTGTEE